MANSMQTAWSHFVTPLMQKYKFITSWVAEYEMQLDPCDYPLY